MTPHLCTFAIAKPHGISVGQRNPLLPYSVRGLKLGTNWQNHTSTDSLLIFLLTSCSQHKLKMIIHICFLSLRAWRWRYGFLLWGPNSTASLHPLGVAWWLRWSLQLKQNFYSSISNMQQAVSVNGFAAEMVVSTNRSYICFSRCGCAPSESFCISPT